MKNKEGFIRIEHELSKQLSKACSVGDLIRVKELVAEMNASHDSDRNLYLLDAI